MMPFETEKALELELEEQQSNFLLYLENEKWDAAFDMVKNPHRPSFLLEHFMGKMSATIKMRKRFCYLARQAWQEEMEPSMVQSHWDDLFKEIEQCSMSLMSKPERDALNDLPPKLKIFRGVRADNQALGEKYCRSLSWTLSQEVAVNFSKRCFTAEGATPFVFSTEIEKSLVLAYFPNGASFGGEAEREILLNPKYVDEIQPFLILAKTD